jgi:hypothetical protein
MADREIRGMRLHEKTVIIMAGQPVEAASWLGDETNQALSARCVFLKIGYDWGYVRQQVGMPLAWLTDGEFKGDLPVGQANSRTVERAVKFIQWAGLSLTPDERETIIRGCLAGGDADNLLNEMRASSWIDLEAAFKLQPQKTIDLLDLNSLCEAGGTMMTVLSDLEVYKAAFRRVFLSPDSTEEHRYKFMDNFFKTLEKLAPNQGDTVEILPGTSDEEFHALMVELVKEYNEGAEARKKAEEAAKKAATVTPKTPAKARAKKVSK